MKTDELSQLPDNLPVPKDDGAAKHLVGMRAPPIGLRATNGGLVRLEDETKPLTVVYCYPRTGRPGAIALGNADLWNAIPGARGCTPHSCSYRDHFEELRELGATVFGLSTQDTEYQREAAERLHLPFVLLSDAQFKFSDALRLPTFEFAGTRLLKRLTLFIRRGTIVHCRYPVFPPDRDAEYALEWIQTQKRSE
jgi:peroxiredoxin